MLQLFEFDLHFNYNYSVSFSDISIINLTNYKKIVNLNLSFGQCNHFCFTIPDNFTTASNFTC